MWSGDRTPYHGKHYRLADPINSPTPLTKPHPPILIGGGGEKKTLRLVAQYADACNLFARTGAAEIKRKLDVLKSHCEAIGRPYDQIERTALGQFTRTTKPSDLIATCRSLAEIGIQHFIFSLENVYEIGPLEIIGREVIPAIADL
jgi:alkanesulfonate monooxygenase SsuD/methylene tetrahydromethanopterin reductase-like flavin-dependent oxidoreductase (luciferase family)